MMMMKALIICALAVGGLTGCEKVVTYEPSPEKRQQDIENQSLAEAKSLAVKNDLEGAHKKLSQLGMEAPARRTVEFTEIENRWAESQIAKADAEPDMNKKLAILQEVSKASAVSPDIRAKASNKIALAVPDPALPPILVNYDPVAAKANIEKCKDLLIEHKMKEAKDLLYPRVMGGVASPEEKEMLASLCVKDASCVAAMQDAGALSPKMAKTLLANDPAPANSKCNTCPKK